MKHPEPGVRAGSREKGASWSSPPFFPGLWLPQIWMKEREERRVEFAIVALGLPAGCHSFYKITVWGEVGSLPCFSFGWGRGFPLG